MRAPLLLSVGLFLVACGTDGPSDEELLERFVSDVTGQVDDDMIQRALVYTDFANVPVDVKAPGHAGVYRAEQAEQIIGAYTGALRRFLWNTKLRVRAKTIAIHGAQADVSIRLFTPHGPLRAETSLQKQPTGWKVSKVHLVRGL